MQSGIYCILNNVNNKRYIGQSQDINLRWKKHKDALNTGKQENKYLQNAWNKYGECSFDFFIIEECSVEDLNKREIYWINYYDSMNNGYNLCEGGAGIRGYKHTAEEIQKMIQIQQPKAVLQLDKDLNVIQKFPSASMAAKSGFPSKRGIKAVCERKNKQKSLYGYIWVYEDEYYNNTIDWDYYINNKRSFPKPINQYNYLGELVRKWTSLYEISNEGGYSTRSIYAIINGKRSADEHANGYYWKYDNGIPLKITVSYYEQYTENGEFICSFRSIKEFALANNLSESSISKCVSGCFKSNHGFIYKKTTRTYILN